MTPIGTEDVKRIGHLHNHAAEDAVDVGYADGSPHDLRTALEKLIGPDQVHSRAIDLVRYASDASPYRLIPQVVLTPRTVGDVQAIFAFARDNGRHLTFRAGGTGLTGQGQSDDLLLDVRHHWFGITVENDAKQVRLRPGTVLNYGNAALARHGRRLGPDPASASAANVGGVVGNNAGGMRCWVERNSYHTVSALTFVLTNGTVINTEDIDAEDQFQRHAPELATGLMEVRREILADQDLVERIRHKYAIRNTNGYQMQAFLDGQTPLQIFRRLLVGSEGTLAFLAEVVFDTLPDPAHRGVALIPTSDTHSAAALIPELRAMGAEACELMYGASLSASTHVWSGLPDFWKTLPGDSAALLLEFREESAEKLQAQEQQVADLITKRGTKLIHPLEFTTDPGTMNLWWTVRDGLAGIASKMRPAGTCVIIEDVCFPPDRIADAATDLQALLAKHNYPPSVAGHAMYGNLHFQLAIDPTDPEDQSVYAAFMKDLVALVVDKYDGSLKAEHGTGINMAPYVEHEWGSTVYEMMWRVKNLADPEGILGKNVLLSRDPDVNMRNFESTPSIEKEATECMECGFCEPHCPSRNVTLTPRQRIVVRREMARQPQGSKMYAALLGSYEYDGIETCAVDGTCQLACPVGINTGDLVKAFRRDESTNRREKIALSVAKHWDLAERLSRDAVGAADVIQQTVGTGLLTGVTEAARLVIASDLMPEVPGPMPRPAPATLPDTPFEGAVAVYFPACINRIFGRDPEVSAEPGLPEVIVTLSQRAGMPVWIPDDVRGKCCATPWASKGYVEGHKWMSAHTVDAILRWTDGGKLPLVVDAASCTWGLVSEVPPDLDEVRAKQFAQVELIDSTQWAQRLLPHLDIKEKVGVAAVHPTCSTTHLGVNDVLNDVALHLAETVYTPIGTTCCGTAGDRGLLHPELVVSATREEKAGLDSQPADAYLSANRTCEMGLEQATHHGFESFAFLLERATR